MNPAFGPAGFMLEPRDSEGLVNVPPSFSDCLFEAVATNARWGQNNNSPVNIRQLCYTSANKNKVH